LPAYKDKEKGTWYASFYYENWKGERKRKLKRGFTTKREALEWEREFLREQSADLDMTFENFVEIYKKDMYSRLKENTWQTKQAIIEKRLFPSFRNKKMSSVSPSDVIQWQNEMMSYKDADGKGYSPTYLKTLHNQLSAIFNHAVKYYELKSNPASKVGNMGKSKSGEMNFWTKCEYLKFADSMMDKPMSYYAFEILYWCGLRIGELLALTPADFDFVKSTVTVNKSYQRIKSRDVITPPKTPKSNRIIKMPDSLNQSIQDCLKIIYGVKPTDRIFPVTKSYFHNEMTRGAKEQGIKRVRVHDIRHSHVSLLIEMEFSAVAIADRLGHESIEITYQYAHLFPSKQAEIADKLDLYSIPVKG